MPRSARLALALGILCGAGCGRPAEAVERERVLRALSALREAPAEALPERRRLLNLLAGEPASAPPVMRARDTCVAAYRLLLNGTELERGVQAELKSDAGPSAATIPRLIEGQRSIKQSGTLMPDCDRAIADLR